MGITLHASRLGDGSDGRSWATAFRTVQAAIDAIPDDRGGHRVIVRPDTYMEGNLYPAAKGAAGAYNVLEADLTGAFGSGVAGYAVLDCGDPELGLKAVDWWSTFRASPDFSGVGWDRWVIRGIYSTGGDAGLFWDLPPKVEPFTVVVEDSVGIGRAFGGGVGNVYSRPEEPTVFRRCRLWSLDWWGDTAGAYIRIHNDAIPGTADVVFEDCFLAGAQCALKVGNPGYDVYSRVRVERSRLVALNFSQPHGTPTDGAIQSVIDGKHLGVDFVDSTVMGYKVFGVRENKETESAITYTTTGASRAYVQYQQQVPAGFQRLGGWPTDVFDALAPAPAPAPTIVEPRKRLVRDPSYIRRALCEMTPIEWRGRLHHLECVRPAEGGTPEERYLRIVDVEHGVEIARFAVGYSLASAIVYRDEIFAFASLADGSGWSNVTMFRSKDMVEWESRVIVTQDPDEHLFNTSVCEAPGGFVLAYETDCSRWVPFSVRFARSTDLVTWEQVEGAVFGRDRYAACPCIRYADGWYYMLYLEHRTPRWWFETYIARSRDLYNWELSPANPVIAAEEIDDGQNASDPDIIEIDGRTYLYYTASDQRTWSNLKRAIWPGPMAEFFASWFTEGGIPDTGSRGL